MKKLALLIALCLCVFCTCALAEDVKLPDVAAFSGGLLTLESTDDKGFCTILIYRGSDADVRRVADAYFQLLTESYGMTEIFTFEEVVSDTDLRYHKAYSAAKHPEIGTFMMNTGAGSVECQLYIDYSQVANNDWNYFSFTYSSGFTYEDTGDRLANAPVSEVMPASQFSDGCTICDGDRVCNTCGGAGYSLMTAYGSNEPIQIACPAGCNVGACPDCIVQCDACGSDGLCDVCGGLAYTTAQAYGSDEMLKIVCAGESCRQGFCAVCMPEMEDRFALVAADANEAAAEPTAEPTSVPTPTPKPEPARTPKPMPTLVPSGQAVFGDGTQIAGLELYSNGEFYLENKNPWPAVSVNFEEADGRSYKPRPIFDGDIISFARKYVNALVESGYYVLEKESDYSNGNISFYLSYAYPDRITPCRNSYLDGYDLVVYVNVENEYILWRINPAITICD